MYNDTSITLNLQTSTVNDTTQIITTYTIFTSATRDTIEMEWDLCAKRSINPDQRAHGTMSWDLAAKTMKSRTASIPFAPIISFIKTA